MKLERGPTILQWTNRYVELLASC